MLGRVFGSKEKNALAEEPEAKQVVHREGAKNRPTRSRKEAEAARRRPLVPNDRAEAKKKARAKAATERRQRQEALMGGDEKYLPTHDKGPVKRFVRNYVDARRNVGEYMLFLLFVPLLLLISASSGIHRLFRVDQTDFLSWVNSTSQVLMMTILALVVVDTVMLGRRLKSLVVSKFGEQALAEKPLRYGVMRALQLRRSRLPKPIVKRGDDVLSS